MSNTESKMVGTVTVYGTEDNDNRCDMSVNPPSNVEQYPTEQNTLVDWIVEFLMEERDYSLEEAEQEVVEAFDQGADGALYREEDMDGYVTVRYSFATA